MAKKSRTRRIPVSQRAIMQRINRRLEGFEKLKKNRSQQWHADLGVYYIVDENLNVLVDKHVDLEKLARKLGAIKAWETISEPEKERFDYLMANYAATIYRMDESVGRLVGGLKERGQFENTLILFLSDNGACYEWGPFGFDGRSRQGATTLHTGADLLEIGLVVHRGQLPRRYDVVV